MTMALHPARKDEPANPAVKDLPPLHRGTRSARRVGLDPLVLALTRAVDRQVPDQRSALRDTRTD